MPKQINTVWNIKCTLFINSFPGCVVVTRFILAGCSFLRAQRGHLGQCNPGCPPVVHFGRPCDLAPAAINPATRDGKGGEKGLPKGFERTLSTSRPQNLQRQRTLMIPLRGGFVRGYGTDPGRGWDTGTNRQSPREWPRLRAGEGRRGSMASQKQWANRLLQGWINTISGNANIFRKRNNF